MTDLLRLFDAYTRRSLIYPALIALTPVIALISVAVPWDRVTLSQRVAALVVVVGYFALGALSRRVGKTLETKLFKKWGGKPSVRVLRYSDQTFDLVSKARYHAFLAMKLGQPAPTAECEQNEPRTADAFYESSGNWLQLWVLAKFAKS